MSFNISLQHVGNLTMKILCDVNVAINHLWFIAVAIPKYNNL